tara:strand:+ start:140 stop:499 length:360 start_codon:yes stop_codon:yes gene_type:complete
MVWEGELLIDLILNNLSESKADKILNIDLNGKSEQADYMVIASGTSNRHVASIAEKLISTVKKNSKTGVRVEGIENADWVLIDCGDVVVHVFRQEVRDFYQLERIWQHDTVIFSDSENN